MLVLILLGRGVPKVGQFRQRLCRLGCRHEASESCSDCLLWAVSKVYEEERSGVELTVLAGKAEEVAVAKLQRRRC